MDGRYRPLARDPDALDYIARVKATGARFGTTLAQERLTEKAVDGYVKMSKEATNSFGKTNWLAMKALNLMSGITTIEGILVPMRPEMAPVTNYNFVQGDLSRLGLKGDSAGSGKYLGSGRNNNADSRDNQSLCVYVSEYQDDVMATIMIGCLLTNITGVSRLGRSAENCVMRSRNTQSNIQSGAHANGFMGMTRHSDSSFQGRAIGATSNHARNAQTPADAELLVFAAGTPSEPSTSSLARLSYFSIGEDLDLEAADLAISTYMAAIS